MNLFVLLTLFYHALGHKQWFPKLDGKIVGGKTVDISDYPYQVSLQYGGSHFCGGAIISPDTILTAAHCVWSGSVSKFTIRVGSSKHSSGGELYTLSSKKIHPNYVTSSLDWDIAILKVSSSISTENALPIKVTSPGTGPTEGALAVVTGWGATKEGGYLSDELQMVEVPVVDQEKCKEAYGLLSDVTDRMFCAGYFKGGKDSCQGDSGGPLVINGTLFGLVSWGIGCARPGYPGVYTNLANTVGDWVIAESEIL